MTSVPLCLTSGIGSGQRSAPTERIARLAFLGSTVDVAPLASHRGELVEPNLVLDRVAGHDQVPAVRPEELANRVDVASLGRRDQRIGRLLRRWESLCADRPAMCSVPPRR